ncbi:unnamed protein product [marine sediment metagenome]|uniref:Uncharacterized protein n=1 Tax=marine sediment metagenome TaxID=412755 RepID=X1SZN6_9ZZZZ
MGRTQRKKISFDEEARLDKHTAEQAGNFLFDLGPEPTDADKKIKHYSAQLSAKTRVKGAKTMSALAYYDVLAQGFDSTAARIVGDSLKRLLIADKGLGREEAKIVLKGSIPEEVEVAVGHE